MSKSAQRMAMFIVCLSQIPFVFIAHNEGDRFFAFFLGFILIFPLIGNFVMAIKYAREAAKEGK